MSIFDSKYQLNHFDRWLSWCSRWTSIHHPKVVKLSNKHVERRYALEMIRTIVGAEIISNMVHYSSKLLKLFVNRLIYVILLFTTRLLRCFPALSREIYRARSTNLSRLYRPNIRQQTIDSMVRSLPNRAVYSSSEDWGSNIILGRLNLWLLYPCLLRNVDENSILVLSSR